MSAFGSCKVSLYSFTLSSRCSKFDTKACGNWQFRSHHPTVKFQQIPNLNPSECSILSIKLKLFWSQIPAAALHAVTGFKFWSRGPSVHPSMHNSHYSAGACGLVSSSSVECDHTWKHLTLLTALMIFEREREKEPVRWWHLICVPAIHIPFSIQGTEINSFRNFAVETHAWQDLKDVLWVYGI